MAIERPDGLLIERLLDAGLSVIAVHPNQLVAMRPRFTAAGGKSDNFDAFVLAELARTDSHRFRVLMPDSDRTKALRAMCRGREDLVRARQALANQLRAQLECFWPGATKVFCEIDSPIALAFLERYPTPVDARYLGEQRLGAFLARHGYCGGRKPAELLARLRGAAHGRAGELETEARRQIVLALVAALKPMSERIEQLRIEIRQALLEHPDGDTFRSLFIDERTVLCPAPLLAEMGDSRDRYPSYRELAADAGQAPVAVESGKSKRARFRWACDHRHAQRSTRSLTPAATTTRGRTTSTPARATAGAPTNTPPGSSAAPGARSSRASGTTATPTTPSDTPRCNASSPPPAPPNTDPPTRE